MGHLIAGINVPILPYTAGIHARLRELTLSCSIKKRQARLRSWSSNDGGKKKCIWSPKQQFGLVRVLPDFADTCEPQALTSRQTTPCSEERKRDKSVRGFCLIPGCCQGGITRKHTQTHTRCGWSIFRVVGEKKGPDPSCMSHRLFEMHLCILFIHVHWFTHMS